MALENKLHPALQFLDNPQDNPSRQRLCSFPPCGFHLTTSFYEPHLCEALIFDLQAKTSQYPYNFHEPQYRGVFRSPFIYSRASRDILLCPDVHSFLDSYFPFGFHLHLNRSVIDGPFDPSRTREFHRDLPFIHTPSTYALSISILTSLSTSPSPQLEIIDYSHSDNFYKLTSSTTSKILLEQGQSIIFDSNLVHRTLPSPIPQYYHLSIFASKLLSPIVSYQSVSLHAQIDYRFSEIDALIDSISVPANSDADYLNRHL